MKKMALLIGIGLIFPMQFLHGTGVQGGSFVDPLPQALQRYEQQLNQQAYKTKDDAIVAGLTFDEFNTFERGELVVAPRDPQALALGEEPNEYVYGVIVRPYVEMRGEEKILTWGIQFDQRIDGYRTQDIGKIWAVPPA